MNNYKVKVGLLAGTGLAVSFLIVYGYSAFHSHISTPTSSVENNPEVPSAEPLSETSIPIPIQSPPQEIDTVKTTQELCQLSHQGQKSVNDFVIKGNVFVSFIENLDRKKFLVKDDRIDQFIILLRKVSFTQYHMNDYTDPVKPEYSGTILISGVVQGHFNDDGITGDVVEQGSKYWIIKDGSSNTSLTYGYVQPTGLIITLNVGSGRPAEVCIITDDQQSAIDQKEYAQQLNQWAQDVKDFKEKRQKLLKEQMEALADFNKLCDRSKK